MSLDLKKVSFVSITCDNWSSNSANEYLGVTRHYIDNQFCLKSNVLCLNYMREAKISNHLSNSLTSTFEQWKLNEKVNKIKLRLIIQIQPHSINNYY